MHWKGNSRRTGQVWQGPVRGDEVDQQSGGMEHGRGAYREVRATTGRTEDGEGLSGGLSVGIHETLLEKDGIRRDPALGP